MIISLIAALAKERVIGFQGHMPWHLPDDLRNFRSLTLNKTVIMGRNTFLSLPFPLPKRHNLVLTSNITFASQLQIKYPEVHVCSNLQQAIELSQSLANEAFVIGGSQIFSQFLPIADYQHLSLIQENFVGDTFYPDFAVEQWQLQSHLHHAKSEPGSPYAWDYLCLRRRR